MRHGPAPLAALTAWQALEKARLPTGQSVPALSVAGAVGHLVVQIAEVKGPRIAGTVLQRALAKPSRLPPRSQRRFWSRSCDPL
jgi:NADPH:quinone reductase-like Zn-dependent oxidoreductase